MARITWLSRLFPFRPRSGSLRRRDRTRRSAHQLWIEPLEERLVLSPTGTGPPILAIAVTSSGDQGDPTQNPNTLSLREAIELVDGTIPLTALSSHQLALIGPGSGVDTIQFDTTVTGPTISLDAINGELPQISQSVNIFGPGSSALAISGSGQSRLFDIAGGTNVEIANLTLTGGAAEAAGANNGGAIFNSGNLTLISSTITGNTASSAGGAIYSAPHARLSLYSSKVEQNVAQTGGALYTGEYGTLQLNNATVSGNSALGGDGGGIYDAKLTDGYVYRSFLQGNSANGDGGAIWNSGTLTLSDSLLTGNTTSGGGGAVYTAYYANTTGNPPSLTLHNDTIAANLAAGNGGGIWAFAGPIVLDNTIVDGNSSGSGSQDINGSVAPSSSFNVVGDAPGLSSGQGNQLGVSAFLDPATFAPLINSPALDAGENSIAPAFDVYGDARIVRSTIDIGAVESAFNFIVNTTGDQDAPTPPSGDNPTPDPNLSLREAIEVTQGSLPLQSLSAPEQALVALLPVGESKTDAIGFDGSLSGQPILVVNGELPTITNALQILGLGTGQLSIEGNSTSRIFDIANSAVVGISDLTVSYGSATSTGESGGDIRNAGRLTLTSVDVTHGFSDKDGGGIANSGNVKLFSSTVSGNTALKSGGGIYSSGYLYMNGSTSIANNYSYQGGGGIADSGTATLWNSTVSGNTAYGSSGGGVYNKGLLTLYNASVSDNSASANGGGIANEATLRSYQGSQLNGNSAYTGGGLANVGTANLSSSTVSGNTASESTVGNGGGIYNTGALNLDVCTVSGNTATANGGGIWSNSLSLYASTSQILDNQAYSGGGIANLGTALVLSSNLSGNLTTGPEIGSGGGVYNTGVLRLYNGAVSQNSALRYGGGIANYGNLYAYSTEFGDNAATDYGGGIANLTGSSVTLSGGSLYSNTAAYGGGLWSYGSATIKNRTYVDYNLSNGVDGTGGGIANLGSGTLSVEDSTIRGNTAVDGGGVFSSGSMSAANSYIEFNSAARNGGGIDSVGPLTISGSSISDNGAQYGGGLYTGYASGVDASVYRSTINYNSAVANGGGIANGGNLTIIDSLVVGNTAENGSGGGIYSAAYLSGYDSGVLANGRLTIDNSTVANNFAAGSGGGVENPGATDVNGYSVVLYDTIVDGNSGAGHTDVDGFIDPSSAYNLIGDAGDTADLATNFNLVAVSANLDSRFTPQDGSLALDSGSNGLGPNNSQILSSDVYGAPRITDGTIDIGAVEAAPHGFTITVDTTLDIAHPADDASGLSLREAIELVNGDIPLDELLTVFPNLITVNFTSVPVDTIQFDLPPQSTIIATNGPLPTIRALEPLNIAGPGATQLTIDGHQHGTVLYFQNYSATLSGVTITGGGGSDYAGTRGGAIRSGASLTLIDDAISGNAAEYGAGIENNGSMTILDSTISGNTATKDGGGIENYGYLVIDDSTIAENTAGGFGGGIENNGSQLKLTNDTIGLNTANSDGGVDTNGQYEIENTIISGNTGGDISSFYTYLGTNHNLISTPSALDPGGLGDHGGTTLTILPAGPAIGGGSVLAAPAAADQRGYSAIVDGQIDIGAVELAGASAGNVDGGNDLSVTVQAIPMAGASTMVGTVLEKGFAIFTITVTNNGPAAQSNVDVIDSVPANTTFVSWQTSSLDSWFLENPALGGTGTVSASIDSLAAGGSATFTLVVQLNVGLGIGNAVTDTASLGPVAGDPDPSNNSQTASSQVGVAFQYNSYLFRGSFNVPLHSNNLYVNAPLNSDIVVDTSDPSQTTVTVYDQGIAYVVFEGDISSSDIVDVMEIGGTNSAQVIGGATANFFTSYSSTDSFTGGGGVNTYYITFYGFYQLDTTVVGAGLGSDHVIVDDVYNYGTLSLPDAHNLSLSAFGSTSTLTYSGITDLTINGSAFYTSPLTFTGPVVLGANTIVNAPLGGGVDFTSTVDGGVDGAYSLQVATDGETLFEAAVGQIHPLSGLTTEGHSSPSAGETAIKGGSIATSGGSQIYDNFVFLFTNTVLTNLGSGAIDFGSSIAGSGVDLDIARSYNDSFAKSVVVGNLSVQSAGGGIVFQDFVNVHSAAIVSGGGSVSFENTVETNGGALSVNSAGGDIHFLQSLDVGNATVLDGGNTFILSTVTAASLAIQTRNGTPPQSPDR